VDHQGVTEQEQAPAAHEEKRGEGSSHKERPVRV
jgi:hypothetical protein